MPRGLLLRHSHTTLRPTPILYAHTYLGGLGAGVVAHHTQPGVAAFDMEGLDSGLGKAVVFDGLGVC